MAVLLSCSSQKYAWGKIGSDSLVARLSSASSSSPVTEEPYAELWMGTHPSGPSKLASSDLLLSEYLAQNPAAIGAGVAAKYGKDIPYLFKVLSVRTALSIQAHPDKTLGAQLHSSRPDLYKDPNHKPEMAIAITPFEVLCSFRPLEDIDTFVKSIPELRAVVGEEAAEAFSSAFAALSSSPSPSSASDNASACLKALYSKLMNADPSLVASQLTSLLNRIKPVPSQQRSELISLVIRLAEQYPGDIGIFSAFFLNYITLEPGQAVFLGANEPHAYIFGDCVECMACSDNVVRAGLTPKFKDVDTLVNMLTYKAGLPSVLSGSPLSSTAKLYSPPSDSGVDEFEIAHVSVPASASSSCDFFAHSGVIALVLSGSGSLAVSSESAVSVSSGQVYFIPAGAVHHWTASADSSLDIFLAAAHRSLQ